MIWKQQRGDSPQVLPGVIEIDDLDGSRKVQIGEVPDPDGAITDDNPECCPFPTSAPSLGVKAQPKLFGGFYGAGIGGGFRIAHGPAFVVDPGLGEHTTELAFPGVSTLALDFADAALGLSGNNGN